jgi:hypothetical protein
MNLNINQISRQDLVDNSIFELLQTLNPTDKRLDWDVEMIADVRDVIQHHIISKTKCSEQDFYP